MPETLLQLPVTLENKNTIEVSLLESKKYKYYAFTIFKRAANIPQRTGNTAVFAFDTKFNEVNK